MAADPARFALAGLGDVLELLAEGWRIERLHYADSAGLGGPAAACFDLIGPGGARRGLYVPEDARALSHRALVHLFRESPRIWKHRSAEAIDVAAEEAASDGWGEVPEPFPQAVAFNPASLREVVPVGQVQSVDGLDIALLALERHDGAARLRYMCHASDAATRQAMRLLDVIAVDDAGRLYRVEAVAGDPEGNRLDGALVIAPAIPPEARRLTVTIGTVAGGAQAGATASGPWVFPIALGDGT